MSAEESDEPKPSNAGDVLTTKEVEPNAFTRLLVDKPWAVVLGSVLFAAGRERQGVQGGSLEAPWRPGCHSVYVEPTVLMPRVL